jgi:hypothetical protein
VRAIGIDTPETGDPGIDVECAGPKATAASLFLTFSATQDTNADGMLDKEGGVGALVELQTDRSQDVRDAFDRALAYIDVVDDIPRPQPRKRATAWASTSFRTASRRCTSSRTRSPQRAIRAGRGAGARCQARSWAACGGNFHSEGG